MRFIEILRARLAELTEQRDALVDELDAIAATAAAEERTALNDVEEARAAEIEGDGTDDNPGELRRLDAEIESTRSRLDQLEAVEARRGNADRVPQRTRGTRETDPFDLRDLSIMAGADELRGRALSAVEAVDGDLEDSHRQRATELLERNDKGGALARRILATGSPAYRSAFQKMAGGASHLLDNEEREALTRALSLTDAEGGFAIPFTLDPTIIMTNDGAANPFRQVARVETITTDSWNGIASSGVSGGYAAEGSEVGDDSPTLSQPTVTPERWDVFVEFTFEIGQDWRTLESDIRMMVNEKRDEFDVVAFTNGTGTNEPVGIITALDGGSSEVAPATAETFAVADVYGVEEALPPKYRRTAAQAKWMAALGTINAIRQFASDDGHALLERLGAGTPRELLGYGLFENSAMDASPDINVAATADNHVLILGDWRNYLIVDRAGMNMELVPHLFATANNRPNGKRGFLAWGRTGADSINDNAFRVLNVATTA